MTSMTIPTLPLLPTVPRLGPILDLPPETTLRDWLAERGQPAMRVGQIRRWLLVGRAESFDAMTDLPQELRQELARSFAALGTTIDRHLIASDGTEKLLIGLGAGKQVESVLIREADRATACISTQVGCGMGCVFCASGLNGVERNLTTGELLEQLIRLRNLTPPEGRLTHIVVMGMGEPLANLDNLLAALEVACHPKGLGLSARHVTISTVGLPAKIRRLAEAGKSYHLAVSLHAPDDRLRTRIVPSNSGTGLAAILEAADDFHALTGRQVTYEYVLLGGLNDSPVEARSLARLLAGRKAHVNLIPFNDVEGLPYRRPAVEAVREFVEVLRRAGLSVTTRKRQGADIAAACGQLRRAAATP
jgi:23S rRNA (adenine2503-C2)-methyltransferase